MKTRARFLKTEISILARKDPRTIEDNEKLLSMRKELYIINGIAKKSKGLTAVDKLINKLNGKLSQRLHEKDVGIV